MDALWCVCGGGVGSKRNYENIIYLKHTLLEFLSLLCGLAINSEDNSLNSVLRRSIFNTPVFVLIMKFVVLYLVGLAGSIFFYQIIWLFFILPHQHYIESVFNS